MFGEGPASLARDYDVTSQSSKVAVAADGLITLHAGYGRGGADYWRNLLDGLRG